KAHLRGELSTLLAAVIKLPRNFRVEENNGLADSDAVFGAAEAKDIDAGLPGQFLRRDPEGYDGVGKAGSIHVNAQAEVLSQIGKLAELVQGIDGSDFGRLGKTEGAGLRIMNIGSFVDRAFDGRRQDFAVTPFEQQHFSAVGEELRCAAFGYFD